MRRIYTGAPARQRRCVERYNIVKSTRTSLPSVTTSQLLDGGEVEEAYPCHVDDAPMKPKQPFHRTDDRAGSDCRSVPKTHIIATGGWPVCFASQHSEPERLVS